MARHNADTEKLAVFICYSREDSAIALALVKALELNGLSVFIDTRDLTYGEKWQRELSENIALSDTVIWLVSEDSIKSKWCNWELDEVQKQHKRMVPVSIDSTKPDDLPRQLGEIHLLPSGEVFDIDKDLNTLVSTLETDHHWIKEYTRLMVRANQWIVKKREDGYVLRGRALADADAWKARQPTKAPQPNPNVLDLILHSHKVGKQQLVKMIGLLLFILFIAAALTRFAYRQANIAKQQTSVALEQTLIADREKNSALISETKARDNETRALTALSESRYAEGHFADATRLALAAWPRSPEDQRLKLPKTLDALSRAFVERREVVRLEHEEGVAGAKYYQEAKKILTWSGSSTFLWQEDGSLIKEIAGEGEITDVIYIAKFDSIVVLRSQMQVAVHIHDLSNGGVIYLKVANVGAMEFLPVSDQLLTWSHGSSAAVWNLKTADLVHVLPHAAGTNVTGASYLPDTNEILTWSTDQTVRLWNAATGEQKSQLQHSSYIRSAHHLPGPDLIHTRYGPSMGYLWNAKSNTVIYRMPNSVDELLMLGSSNRAFIRRRFEESAEIWDTAEHKTIAEMKHDSAVAGSVYSKELSRILTWTDDGNVFLWNLQGEKQTFSITVTGAVSGAIFLSNRSRVLIWDSNGVANIWNLKDGRSVAELKHNGPISGAFYANETGRVMTWSEDKTVRIWEQDSATLQFSVMLEKSAEGHSLLNAARHSQEHIVSWSGNTVNLWDANTGEKKFTMLQNHHISRTVELPDLNRLVTWSQHRKWGNWIWNTKTGEKVAVIKHRHDLEGILPIDGTRRLFTRTSEAIARLWDLGNGDLVAELPHDSKVMGERYLSNSRRLLTWSEGSVAKMWDAESGKFVIDLEHDDHSVSGAAYLSEIGKILTWTRNTKIGYNNRVAKLWDETTGEQVAIAHAVGQIQGVIFLPKPKRILTWSTRVSQLGSRIEIWDPDTLTPVEFQRKMHMSISNTIVGVKHLQASDNFLTWYNNDESAHVWDGVTGRLVAELRHDKKISGVSYLPTLTSILTWSHDGTVRLWDETTGRALAVLPVDKAVSGADFSHVDNGLLTWGGRELHVWKIPWISGGSGLVKLACERWRQDTVTSFSNEYGIRTEEICESQSAQP